jgi:hypothetical protein
MVENTGVTSDNPDPFQYPPLDLSQPLIRVIQLVPNSADEPVCCNMSVVPLSARYAALSYVWGQDDSEERIYVNGKLFRIRRNLLNFLKCSRDKIVKHGGDFDPIFIDALCINQSNTAERNHQVRQMGNIYRAAMYTIAWLGCGATCVERLFIAAAGAARFRNYDPWPRTAWTNILRDPLEANDDEALKVLCGLEYWSRLWIVPEVILARTLFFAYGEQELAAQELFGLLINIKKLSSTYYGAQKVEGDHLQRLGVRWRHIFETSEATGFCDQIESGHRRTEYIPIGDVQSFSSLAYAHGLKDCFDCRDRIFALLAISSDYSSNHIDYDDTALTVFTKLQTSSHEANPVRFAKQLSQMLHLGTGTPQFQGLDIPDGKVYEMTFRGGPIFRLATWAFDALCPPAKAQDLATEHHLPVAPTEFELQFCRPFDTHTLILVLPTKDELSFVTAGVLSEDDLDSVKWLGHECNLILPSREALECSARRLDYRLVPSSLVAFLELLDAIDINDLKPSTHGSPFQPLIYVR